MLVLLSPSKTQDFQTDVDLPPGSEPTTPRMLEEAAQVMEALRALPREELHRRLKLSPRLVGSVDAALDAWSGAGPGGAAEPAAFAYTGETYRGLAVRELDGPALRRVQQQVRILSALYGVLRPLDAIEQYRLDFGVSLAVDGSRSLYEYWRGRITTRVAEDVRESGAGAVVNLASGEFARAVDPGALGVELVSPEFRQREGGKLKNVTVFTKQARGSMARWIACNSITTPDQLLHFQEAGYRYLPEESAPGSPVFVREAG